MSKPKRGSRNAFFKFNIQLILPLEGVLNFLLVVPFSLAIYLSLTNWTPYLGELFSAPIIGGQNFLELVLFGRFLNAVANTLIILMFAVPAELLIGLGLALALYSWQIRGKAIFMSVLLMPMMVMPTVVGFTFFTMFYREGPVNQVLYPVFGEIVLVEYLIHPATAMLTVIIADIWQWTPFMFLIIYAGLMALPRDPIRAARVLGASELQIFRYVIFPLLKPVILIAVLIRAIEVLKIFDVPFVATKGGPGIATETISIFLYRFGVEFGRLAFASAGAILIFAVIVAIMVYLTKPLMPKPAERR